MQLRTTETITYPLDLWPPPLANNSVHQEVSWTFLQPQRIWFSSSDVRPEGSVLKDVPESVIISSFGNAGLRSVFPAETRNSTDVLKNTYNNFVVRGVLLSRSLYNINVCGKFPRLYFALQTYLTTSSASSPHQSTL